MWTRIDGNTLRDRSLLQVSRSARYLYIEMLCYSNDQGTDGIIQLSEIRTLTDVARPKPLVDALVSAGVLEMVSKGGTECCRIVGFFDDQLTHEEVLARNKRSAETTERNRRHRAGDHSKCDPKRCHALLSVTGHNNGHVTDHVTVHDTKRYETKRSESEVSEVDSASAIAPASGLGASAPANAPAPEASKENGSGAEPVADGNGSAFATKQPPRPPGSNGRHPLLDTPPIVIR
jgi:hypothetical protein